MSAASRTALLAVPAALLTTLVAGPALAADDGAAGQPAQVQVAPGGIDIRAPVLDLQVGTADLDGAVSTSRTGSVAQVTLDADVLFAFDRADLSPTATGRLAGVADALTASTGTVTVDGYTDAKGAAGYNQLLSERRARAVADALGRRQPSVASRLVARGHGAGDPVAPNTKPDGSDNPAGRAANRRVTVTYTVNDVRR